MDLFPIVLGIAAINVGVFLAGCTLAVYRTWREDHPSPRRRVVRRAPLAAIVETSAPAMGRPGH